MFEGKNLVEDLCGAVGRVGQQEKLLQRILLGLGRRRRRQQRHHEEHQQNHDDHAARDARRVRSSDLKDLRRNQKTEVVEKTSPTTKRKTERQPQPKAKPYFALCRIGFARWHWLSARAVHSLQSNPSTTITAIRGATSHCRRTTTSESSARGRCRHQGGRRGRGAVVIAAIDIDAHTGSKKREREKNEYTFPHQQLRNTR